MRVSELTDEKLDYWVAKADEKNAYVHHGNCFLELRSRNKDDYGMGDYSPSTDWSQGGPIIEREKIKIAPIYALRGGEFMFWSAKALKYILEMEGDTALIAAMRCYVASKFGEEVPDEPIS